MRKTLLVAGLLSLVAPSLGAQSVRWNDAPTSTWSDEAPRIRLSIDGNRGVSFGGPVLVRFEVSDNAYVAVVRVDGEGRMTILYPYSRNQRAAARGGLTYYIRHPRLGGGNASFYANDRYSGYVFAIASYSPLDFSSFENRDYDRIGGMSRFTMVNRNSAFRPDVFVDKFAARVLWDVDTPYDYDVDYYHPGARPGMLNTYSMCAGLYDNRYGTRHLTGAGSLDWGLWDVMPYPYNSMCRSWYGGVHCLSMLSLYSYTACNTQVIASNGPNVPGTITPSDSTVPNKGVVTGGMAPPTPPSIPTGGPEVPPLERTNARFDEWDKIMSIPSRATRKMKEEDARKVGAAQPSGRETFDRAVRPEKASVADGSEPVRTAAPTREPVKTKGTVEPRDEPSRSRGLGSGSTSTRPFDPDRSTGGSSRPTEAAKPASTPVSSPTLQGTSTTEKKKPPTD